MDFRYDPTFAQQLVEVADEANRVNCELTVEKALEQIKSLVDTPSFSVEINIFVFTIPVTPS